MMNTLEAVNIVCPKVIQMAHRLEFAVHQIQAGRPRRDVVRLVIERFQCSRMTAWRVWDMANDLAGEVK